MTVVCRLFTIAGILQNFGRYYQNKFVSRYTTQFQRVTNIRKISCCAVFGMVYITFMKTKYQKPNTREEIIVLINALAKGEKIEFSDRQNPPGVGFIDWYNPAYGFDFNLFVYRLVKPTSV